MSKELYTWTGRELGKSFRLVQNKLKLKIEINQNGEWVEHHQLCNSTAELVELLLQDIDVQGEMLKKKCRDEHTPKFSHKK